MLALQVLPPPHVWLLHKYLRFLIIAPAGSMGTAPSGQCHADAYTAPNACSCSRCKLDVASPRGYA